MGLIKGSAHWPGQISCRERLKGDEQGGHDAALGIAIVRWALSARASFEDQVKTREDRAAGRRGANVSENNYDNAILVQCNESFTSDRCVGDGCIEDGRGRGCKG